MLFSKHAADECKFSRWRISRVTFRWNIMYFKINIIDLGDPIQIFHYSIETNVLSSLIFQYLNKSCFVNISICPMIFHSIVDCHKSSINSRSLFQLNRPRVIRNRSSLPLFSCDLAIAPHLNLEESVKR